MFDLALAQKEIAETRFSGRLHHLDETESTNQLALWAAQAGANTGAWIADAQSAGRGRGDHAWHSPPGEGLYLSLLVRPPVPMGFARSIPLATGLAVQAAVREVTGLELDLRWPNDLLFGDRKCGGILVESANENDRLKYAVIGIGLNINHPRFPPELAAIATSLHLESGRYFDREPLAGAIIRNVDREMTLLTRDWHGTNNKRPLSERFTEASTWVAGKHVRVEEGGGYTGWTRGLDPDGFLRVECEDGTVRTVLSGGVRSF